MITLADALHCMTVDQIKPLIALLGDASIKGRKDELVSGLTRSLSASRLRELWGELDDLQRLAVAQTLYAEDGFFHSHRFLARHGRLPAFTTPSERRSHSGSPTRLALFLFPCDRSYCVPTDLRPALRTFVAEPEPVRITGVETLPATFCDEALTVRPAGRDAFVDLSGMLRLAEQGKIQISDKTSLPTASTLRLLTEKLAGGDFYADEPLKNAWDQPIGSIKAFAWPMLLQAAGLVQRNGSKLALSKAGLKAVASVPADVVAIDLAEVVEIRCAGRVQPHRRHQGATGPGSRDDGNAAAPRCHLRGTGGVPGGHMDCRGRVLEIHDRREPCV